MTENVADFSLEKVLMDGISDMVFVVRVENESTFIYEFLNRAAMDVKGLTKNDVGKSIRDVFPKEKGDFLYDTYRKVLINGETVIYEDSYMGSSEEKRYSKTTLIPLFNDDKICTHIVATVKDITAEKLAKSERTKAWKKLNKKNKRYQSLFHHNSDAIFSFDLTGRITHGNVAVEDVTGYKPLDLVGATLYSLVVKENINIVKNLFIQAVGGTTGIGQLVIHNKEGNRIKVSLKVTPLIVDEDVLGIYGILRDVTDITDAANKLHESEERFRIIAENAHDLITLVDGNGKIIYASPSYKDILGFDYKEYVGRFFLHNIHPDDSNHINQMIIQSIKDGQPFTVQFKQYNHQNKPIWSESHVTPVFDDQRNFKHLVVLTRDISLNKQYESKLRHFALHDSLTGLPNRRLFKERLTQTLEGFQDKEEKVAVIMMDIDHFKNINDKMGHDIGDEVIEEFAKRVSATIRDCDTAARLGGDEFVIILPKIGSVDNATVIAEDIQRAMQQPWNIDSHSIKVTTSMGIALVSSQDTTSFSILKNADIALYEAKNSGRNAFKLKDFTV